MHPDKVGAENAKLGAEATIVINELRQFVKEDTQKANQILTNERQLISESQFEFLTPNDIAKIFNQKIAAILEWKENARLAILEAEERHKLEEQLREIKMQIAELKRGGIIGSHSSSDLVNLAAQKMTNFKLFTLKKIPQSKLAKLNREHEQMAKKIEQHVDQEYLLIKAPKNNPSEVYKMWKQWESLAFTKDFYKQIEQKYN
ncbi:hypothetical protein niasHT_033413 [Heterodera trifolii]|uniref:J domain-containing protein n=1 Tax=Heterodera trifolii TaxID=157864 RepID=A0ABD2HXU2_9BILA